MIKNFFKVAFRNMKKQKFFAVINLFGLTVGISACLFIAMYIADELSYDKFFPNAERIYRINLHGKLAGQEILTSSSNSQLPYALETEIPEVEEATRIFQFDEWVFRKDDLIFTERHVYAADSGYFDVFQLDFIEGEKEGALTGPNKVVLTKSVAEKYFRGEPAVGQIMNLGNDKTEYIVTGVIEDLPHNTQTPIEVFLSMDSFEWMNPKQAAWLSNSFLGFYVLREGASSETVDEKLRPIIDQNVSPILKEFMGKTLEEMEADGGIYEYFSIPLTRIHLYSTIDDESVPVGDIKYVYILGAIGLFILLIAAINFMNLSTAKYANRAKEVGLRKTMGSTRRPLVAQFISESVLYAALSTLLAVAIVSALLSSFNRLSGKEMELLSLFTPSMIVIMISLTLLIGLLAGSYPAFYLTSFDVAETLKGKLKGVKGGRIRSFLVTFQFWISIILIICTAIVFRQIQYMQNERLGFDKDKVMIIEGVTRLGDNTQAFKNEILANSNVESISFSNNELPGVNNTTIFRQAGSDYDHICGTFYTDEDFASTMGIEMIEGRYFSRDFPSDSLAIVINESAVREFGFANPLEERIISFNDDEPVELQVIGVMKDFNFESIKTPIRPLLLLKADFNQTLYVRYSNNVEDVIRHVEENWSKLALSEPLEYSFLDQDFDNLFREEQRLGSVFTIFTAIAISIACLGLFGLASFIAEQRTKEIGVRKVMGASVWNITNKMSFQFIKLVVLAFALAVIPAYYFMNQWLDDFPLRIDIGLGVFLLAGIISVVIAYLTVSIISYFAASANPIKSLRYE
jgi:putative ABC transport system permease protein